MKTEYPPTHRPRPKVETSFYKAFVTNIFTSKMYRLTQGLLTKLGKDNEDNDFDYYSRGNKESKPNCVAKCWISFSDWICRSCSKMLPPKPSRTAPDKKRQTDMQSLFSPGGLSGVQDKDLHVIKTAHLPVIWVMGGPGTPIEALIDRLAQLYNFHHVTVGQMLKEEIATGTGRTDMATRLMHRGVIIPRRFLNEMIKQNMAQAILKRKIDGFIFSDFPTCFSQANAFVKTISDVDFILVLQFDRNTARLCAYDQLQNQTHSSRHMYKTREELKVSVEQLVEKYNDDLRKLYKLKGNKMQVVDAGERIGEFYQEAMKWIERAMILHDIRPPEVDPPAQLESEVESEMERFKF